MTMEHKLKKKAVVLVSGGLDSATTLALAMHQGYTCYALSFNYGQRHATELKAAQKIAALCEVKEHKTISFDLSAIGGSALTDMKIEIPRSLTQGIPVTYVPARNTIFLSFALGWAEVLEAEAIFIGVNAIDYSGYPDCRPEYIEAFQTMANLATKMSVQGNLIKIYTPLIHLTKAEIIKQGTALGIDFSLTISCYQADEQGRACAKCDSCRLRKQGFLEAVIEDPTLYATA